MIMKGVIYEFKIRNAPTKWLGKNLKYKTNNLLQKRNDLVFFLKIALASDFLMYWG